MISVALYYKIMGKINNLLAASLLLTLAACTKVDPEEQGRQMLCEARAAYTQGDYTAARDTILSLRQRFPKALDARRQAILLLDSVELKLADGDSLKQEFFRRKLEHDVLKMRE